MTEAEIEHSLLWSKKMLLEGQTNRRLLDVLLSEFRNLEQAFVIDWIPEQGEDIYTIAVSEEIIATVEIPRDENTREKPLIEITSFERYERDAKNMTKATRRKLSTIKKLLKDNA